MATPLSIHHAVADAVREFLANAEELRKTGLEPERERALSDCERIASKGTTLPLLVAWLPPSLLVFGAAVLDYERHTNIGYFAFALWTAAAILWTIRSSRRMMTEEQMVALAPALRLSRVQGAYLDSWILLRTLGPDVDPEGELEAGLGRLLDEEARLLASRAKAQSRATPIEAIVSERDALDRRLAATSDPVAREALAHGLQTCERRLAVAGELSRATGRIDAQLEMIAQSALDVRDGLLRMREAPEGADVGTESAALRETLAHVQTHAAALEAAVIEVGAI